MTIQDWEKGIRGFKHGLAGTPFYRKWGNIRARCCDSKHPNYKNYGGRGIKCGWDTFADFHRDMYASYVEHVVIQGQTQTTIDRINPDGDYSKENCRWATRHLQTMNRRKSVRAQSGFLGVYYVPRKTSKLAWKAGIHIDGKRRYVGAFASKEEAARAYDRMALEAWGDVATLNYPLDNKSI